jgi:hypothetical protein
VYDGLGVVAMEGGEDGDGAGAAADVCFFGDGDFCLPLAVEGEGDAGGDDGAGEGGSDVGVDSILGRAGGLVAGGEAGEDEGAGAEAPPGELHMDEKK